MILIFQLMLFFIPWKLRRRLLCFFLKFDVSSDAYIGFSLISAKKVSLMSGARIGHFNLIRNLDSIRLADGAIIGTLNWIAGASGIRGSFVQEVDRESSLILGKFSAITHQHIFDCTNTIFLDDFSTVAGYRSQFITHGIDFKDNTQRSSGISIGKYCLIGTGVIALKGVVISDRSVVAAGALLNGLYLRTDSFIAGVPGRLRDDVEISGKYFSRKDGRVD